MSTEIQRIITILALAIQFSCADDENGKAESSGESSISFPGPGICSETGSVAAAVTFALKNLERHSLSLVHQTTPITKTRILRARLQAERRLSLLKTGLEAANEIEDGLVHSASTSKEEIGKLPGAMHAAQRKLMQVLPIFSAINKPAQQQVALQIQTKKVL